MLERSDAGIFVVSREPEGTLTALKQVMMRKRYRAFSGSIPEGYPLALDERLLFELGRAGALTLARTPVDSVFRVAHWWTQEFPEQPLAAVRCYAHSSPCLKFFSGGRPTWRIGDDHDYEVDYEVPTRRAVDVPDPETLGLPTSERAAAAALSTLTVELISSWLRADSRLS